MTLGLLKVKVKSVDLDSKIQAKISDGRCTSAVCSLGGRVCRAPVGSSFVFEAQSRDQWLGIAIIITSEHSPFEGEVIGHAQFEVESILAPGAVPDMSSPLQDHQGTVLGRVHVKIQLTPLSQELQEEALAQFSRREAEEREAQEQSLREQAQRDKEQAEAEARAAREAEEAMRKEEEEKERQVREKAARRQGKDNILQASIQEQVQSKVAARMSELEENLKKEEIRRVQQEEVRRIRMESEAKSKAEELERWRVKEEERLRAQEERLRKEEDRIKEQEQTRRKEEESARRALEEELRRQRAEDAKKLEEEKEKLRRDMEEQITSLENKLKEDMIGRLTAAQDNVRIELEKKMAAEMEVRLKEQVEKATMLASAKMASHITVDASAMQYMAEQQRLNAPGVASEQTSSSSNNYNTHQPAPTPHSQPSSQPPSQRTSTHSQNPSDTSEAAMINELLNGGAAQSEIDEEDQKARARRLAKERAAHRKLAKAQRETNDMETGYNA